LNTFLITNFVNREIKLFIMRYILTLFVLTTFSNLSTAQFKPVQDDRLTIIVTDGTDQGKNSEVQKKQQNKKVQSKDIPSSYGTVQPLEMEFLDPIRPLGMDNAIQAAAFLERPVYGRAGFMLIFSVNDSIGGEQGTYITNGEEYKGVYRLIRQKYTPEEPIPRGMAPYKIDGTIFILGVS